MLELHILRYLMNKQGSDKTSPNRMIGYSVSTIQNRFSIPRSTFHRAINELLAQQFIVRVKRDEYRLDYEFKVLCYAQRNGKN